MIITLFFTALQMESSWELWGILKLLFISHGSCEVSSICVSFLLASFSYGANSTQKNKLTQNVYFEVCNVVFNFNVIAGIDCT